MDGKIPGPGFGIYLPVAFALVACLSEYGMEKWKDLLGPLVLAVVSIFACCICTSNIHAFLNVGWKIPGPVVLVGDTGGMDEIITSGVDGFEVPIENFSMDSDLLAHTVFKSSDSNLRKKISRNAAKRVQSRFFDWDFIVKRVFDIYDKSRTNFKVYRKYC